MAFDGLFLHMMKTELSRFAVGSKIDKIYVPTKYELVVALRSRTGSEKLFISVGGNAPRISFTGHTPENPSKPPMLCMLLRKLLTGAVITDIRQQGLDRVMFIDLDASNEIGDRVKRTLVVEIMAQYSNCVLLDENGVIIDSLKRVDMTKSSYREVLPGRRYVLPPSQDKLNILENDSSTLTQRIISFGDKTLSGALLSSLSGVSPLTSRELAYRICLGDKKVNELGEMHIERLKKELDELRNALISGETKPCYLTDENGEMLEFSFMPLTLYANDAKINRCSTLSELLDIYYIEREKKLRARAQAEDLFKTVSSLVERAAKKVNVRREELPDDDEIEERAYKREYSLSAQGRSSV